MSLLHTVSYIFCIKLSCKHFLLIRWLGFSVTFVKFFKDIKGTKVTNKTYSRNICLPKIVKKSCYVIINSLQNYTYVPLTENARFEILKKSFPNFPCTNLIS